MDAHLFRLFINASLPLLTGARIEKIQEFAPDHLAISFFDGSQKNNLYLRFGRKEPFCFLSKERVTALPRPTSQIMRIRKYFAGRRLSAVVPQIWSRKLWLMASEAGAGKAVWLCLDLPKGPELHFLDLNSLPEPEEARWPLGAELESALQDWRDWPVLTPALRKTLALLPEPEQRALLADLADGAGDVFLYLNETGQIEEISAWPLQNRGGLQEIASEQILTTLEKAGGDLVLGKLFEQKNQRLLAPGQKKIKKLLKLLDKLKADETRLLAMASKEENAAKLAANIWRWPKESKQSVIDIDGSAIQLDARFTLIENMERMYHEVRRGKRGLALLAERRQELEAELRDLELGGFAPTQPKQDSPSIQKTALIKNLPRHTQAFLSSDGYLLLRGRDGRGNLAIRRLASGHDIWVHVEQGSGSHVIIRRAHAGHAAPERTIIEAGTLAANKSWLAEASSGSVMYAEVRHVKPVRGAPPGKVTIDRIKETRIVPVDHELEKRLQTQKLVDFEKQSPSRHNE